MSKVVYISFFAGVFSFFSPYFIDLVPTLIEFLDNGKKTLKEKNKKEKMYEGLLFISGFTLIFMIIGIFFSILGKFFNMHISRHLMLISGLFILFFAANLLGLFRPMFFHGIKHLKIKNLYSSFYSGLALASGWTAFFGPLYLSILIFVAASAQIFYGILVFFIYSIGLGIPCLLSIVFNESFDGFIHKYRYILEKWLIFYVLLLLYFGIYIISNL